jgi:hypothetical protein
MNSVVIIVRKSGLDDLLKNLLNEIVEHKILLRIMEDEDFDNYIKTK